MPDKCVDASVALKWVLPYAAWRRKARRFLQHSRASGFTLIAPALFDYETESAVQTEVQASRLTRA
jgi:predicted nucleic acid-binding protein